MKKKYEKYNLIVTILKSFDTIVFIAITSNSITFSLTEIGLIVIPISTGIACGLTNSNNVIHEIVMQKYNEYKNCIKKINNQLNLLVNYIEKVCKII